MPWRILIVDDEPNILVSFSSLLEDEGHHTVAVTTAEEAAERCSTEVFDLILLDLQLPGQPGMEFLRKLKSNPQAPGVLVISGQADIPAALEAVRLGAVDFLEKPVQPEKLISSVSAGLALAAAERQRAILVQEIDDECRIIGDSPAIGKLLRTIRQVAPTDTTVLVTGENGTGKELVATRLYLESNRRDRPFLKVNCPGIPESLFESELFGHMKGSFTGAVRDHAGKFLQANSGTIFLDEIGDLPLSCQAKLLRVLETGEVETLGLENHRQVNVRVICATNRNLKNLVSEGKFREDLFYRVSVFIVDVPPLSSRLEDVPLLVGEFLKQFDPSGQTKLSATSIAYLGTLPYPGNVRQLKNIIERLTILYSHRNVEVEDLISQLGQSVTPEVNASRNLPLSEQIRLFEKQIIERTLQDSNGNISQASRLLGVDRANLSRKIKDLGLRNR